MDVFNPRFLSEFLEPVILRNLKEPMQGYWVQNNMPFIGNFKNEVINPLRIPFRPGSAFSAEKLETLPETSTHDIGANTQV